MMRRSAGLLLFFLLTACAAAPTAWVRSDTSAVQRQKDEVTCRQIASDRAYEESLSSKPLYPPWTGTGFDTRWPGAPGYRHESPSYFARGPRMGELFDYCMRERGYRPEAITVVQ
jgi:hypothetical protein